MVFRRASISIILWTAVSAAPSSIAEENVPAKQSADPLAAAKRDYAAIRASGIETGQMNGLKAPHSAPPLELPSDGPPALSPMQRARLLERRKLDARANRSNTWLIDALRDRGKSDLKEPGTPHPGKNQASDRDWLLDSAQREQGPNELSRVRTESKSKDVEPSDKRPSSDIRNPLDPYMAQWMTGRDLEILKASRESAPSSVESLVAVATQPATNQGVTFFRAADVGARHDLINSDPFSSARSQATNPYLELMKPASPRPEQTFGIGAASNTASASALPSIQDKPVRLEQPEIPASKPLSAELLKAQDDARYFKQLKRF